jgi:hypothetical protein
MYSRAREEVSESVTTPASTLITRPGARLAYVLEIEGHDVAFTDVPDLTTWGDYTVRPGLQMRGTISREIDLLGYNLSPVGFEVELVDTVPWSTSDSLAKLFAEQDASAIVTELMGDVDRTATTIPVRSTTFFPSEGVIHIGHERIEYAGKTAAGSGNPATFTGCVRGTFPAGASAGGTNTGRWAHTHRVALDGAGPQIASQIRIWKNRMVTMYVVAFDPDTCTWNARENALNEIVGTIEDYKPSGRVWSLSCVTLEKRMQGQLFKDQYRGFIQEGITFRGPVRLHFHTDVFGAHDANTGEIEIPRRHYTVDQLVEAINGALTAADLVVNTVAYELSFALAADHVVLRMAVPGGGTYHTTIESVNSNGSLALRVLGWPTAQATIAMVAPGVGAIRTVLSPERAIGTFWGQGQQGALDVAPTAGVWEDQPEDDLPSQFSGTHGYIQVGDAPHVWLASRTNDPVSHVDSFAWAATFDFQGAQVTTGSYLEAQVRYLGEDLRIPVRQVWIVRDTLSRLLLRMLLSTGTRAYNDTRYDRWPSGMSCGLPANLVDIASIEALSDHFSSTGMLFQVLLQPENAADHIESLMRTLGFHLLWRRTSTAYKLMATIPTTVASLEPVATLDASNTGNQHYTESASGAELVRNRITIRYNRDALTGEFHASETYDNLASMSEQDEPSALEYDALGLYDYEGSKLADWRQNVAAPICAYFGRPIRKHTRSGSRMLWFVGLGDVVVFNDADAPDAVAGTYGTSSVKAWVVAVTKNYETYELDSITVLVPPSNTVRLAPSATIDFTRADKGYDAANLRLYVLPSEFTRQGDAKDVSWFFSTDQVLIVEIDPPGSPTSWARTVAAVGPNYVDLTIGLTTPAFDPTKRYYITLRPYPQASQNPARRRASNGVPPGEHVVAFVADDANYLDDGASGQDAMLWGMELPVLDSGLVPTGDEHYRRPADTADDPNAPLSAHVMRDLVYAVNNLYRHAMNQHPISDQWLADVTNRTGDYRLLAGPYKVWCPPGVESLSFSIDAFSTASTSFRVTCSAERPGGQSTTVPQFEGVLDQTVVNTPPLQVMSKVTGSVNIRPNGEGYAYVTLEGHANQKLVGVRAISAYFAPRPLT